jgi:hypothetical protein
MITWGRVRRITSTSRPVASSTSACQKQSGLALASDSGMPESR